MAKRKTAQKAPRKKPVKKSVARNKAPRKPTAKKKPPAMKAAGRVTKKSIKPVKATSPSASPQPASAVHAPAPVIPAALAPASSESRYSADVLDPQSVPACPTPRAMPASEEEIRHCAYLKWEGTAGW